MTLGERIKMLRKALDLTQQEFANQIGTTRDNIAGYETGRREPSAAAISLIIVKLNVSETWLRTGKGEMFEKTPDSIAGQLAAEFGLDEFLQSVVNEYLKLNLEQRTTVRDFVYHIASEIPTPAAPPREMSDAEYHAELDRQLTGEKRPAESGSASGHGSSGTVAG